MRLIDADKLHDTIEKWERDYLNFNRDCLDATTDEAIDKVEVVSNMLDNTPTVDAVPVVRCRECGYYKAPVVARDSGICVYACRNELTEPDNYCSRGVE